MGTQKNRTDLIRKCMIENPTIKGNRTIAKIVHNKYPLLFKDVEQARHCIRRIMDAAGKSSRHAVGGESSAFVERLAKLRAESKIEESEHADVTPYVINSRFKKILVISDTHIPYVDMKALDIALEYGFNEKVDAVVINGDFLDFGTISKYLTKPNAPRMIESIEQGKEILKYIKSALGCKVIFHEGNHDCYDKDTEVLTNEGFVLFSDLKQTHSVAQFDDNMNISFDLPLNYIKKKYCGEIYDIETNYSYQSVTDNHDVVIRNKKNSKLKAKDVLNNDLRYLPTHGFCNYLDYEISDELLKLLTWIVCDGTIIDETKYGKPKARRVQFKLSKDRKIKSLQKLLVDANIEYTFKPATKSGMNVLQPYLIRIYGDYGRFLFSFFKDGVKQFPDFFKRLSKRQADIVISTILETDGTNHDGGISWSTVCKKDADTIQEMCILNGINANIRIAENYSGFSNGKTQYISRFNITDTSCTTVKKISTRSYDDYVYCVQMPMGTVVTRKNNKVAFSGNCRVENYLINKAPEFWGLPIIQLENLLECKKMNIDHVSNIRTMHYGKLVICHGNHIVKGIFSPVNPARGAFTKANASIMISHVHRSSEHIETDIKGKVIGCWSLGCLTTVTPEYNCQVSKHNQGFAVVTLSDKDGNFEVDNRKIIEYRVR